MRLYRFVADNETDFKRLKFLFHSHTARSRCLFLRGSVFRPIFFVQFAVCIQYHFGLQFYIATHEVRLYIAQQ